MKNTYTVRIQKLSKFHGETNKAFVHGEIHEEVYEYEHEDYGDALTEYKTKCLECTEQVSMGIIFNHCYTIQLLNHEGTNAISGFREKRRIEFQITISSL